MRKFLKRLGLYKIYCRVFLPNRKFIIESFVYIDKQDKIVKGEITDRIYWLERFKTEAHSIEDAESEFWSFAQKTYNFYEDIWIY